MLNLYDRIRNLIVEKFPDHTEHMGLGPEQYPTLYECRYTINAPKPFAFAMSAAGEDRLFLALYPALWSDNHDPYTIHRIFDSNGISFTSEGAESFSIIGPESLQHLSVFYLPVKEEKIVYGFVPYSENELIDAILGSPIITYFPVQERT